MAQSCWHGKSAITSALVHLVLQGAIPNNAFVLRIAVEL